jgi:hypothetical protein
MANGKQPIANRRNAQISQSVRHASSVHVRWAPPPRNAEATESVSDQVAGAREGNNVSRMSAPRCGLTGQLETPATDEKAAKHVPVHTQLVETEGTSRRNGFEFAKDQIAGAGRDMDGVARGQTRLLDALCSGLTGTVEVPAPGKKAVRVHTQADEKQRAPVINGVEFANDQITPAIREMRVLAPQHSTAEKYPRLNGFVFANDGTLLSVHNGFRRIDVMRPGFQWRGPISRPGSRSKKRPVPPHYN